MGPSRVRGTAPRFRTSSRDGLFIFARCDSLFFLRVAAPPTRRILLVVGDSPSSSRPPTTVLQRNRPAAQAPARRAGTPLFARSDALFFLARGRPTNATRHCFADPRLRGEAATHDARAASFTGGILGLVPRTHVSFCSGGWWQPRPQLRHRRSSIPSFRACWPMDPRYKPEDDIAGGFNVRASANGGRLSCLRQPTLHSGEPAGWRGNAAASANGGRLRGAELPFASNKERTGREGRVRALRKKTASLLSGPRSTDCQSLRRHFYRRLLST